ncbi:MAG: InlB B-repeat-containing protein, partial [Coriobacteriia bacterium]|nr:InlB B-repeat-containing protein [Coriobacteriia bacterium]
MTRRNILLILISLLMALNSLPLYSSMFADDPEANSEQSEATEQEAPDPGESGGEGQSGATQQEPEGTDGSGEDAMEPEEHEPCDDPDCAICADNSDQDEEHDCGGVINCGDPVCLLPLFVEGTGEVQPGEVEAGGSQISPTEGGGIVPLADYFNVTYYIGTEVFAFRPTGDDGKALNLVVFPFQYPTGATLFRGWYPTPGGTTLFDFTQIIDRDIELYAQFEMSYLIKYKSEPGGTGDDYVIDTKVLMEGQPVPETTEAEKLSPPASMPNGHIAHWYIEGEDENIPFIFGVEVASQDLTLVPYWSDLFWVYFESEGSAVTPQLVQYRDTATVPTPPSRLGYDFAGWTLEYPNGPTFDFGTPIEQDTTLYAKWTALPVSYTVVVWMEKPNIAGDPGTDSQNYMFSMEIPATALAGSTVDYSTLAGVTANLGFAPDVFACEFHHGDTRAVSGTGLTVVNVYYNRVVYRFTFDLQPGGSSGFVRNYTEMTFEGIKYQQGVDVFTGITVPTEQYEIYVKYEQDIEDIWPSSWNIDRANTRRVRYSATGPGGTWELTEELSFSGWESTGVDSLLVTKRFTVTTDMVPTAGTERVYGARWSSSVESYVEYWLETLPGETGVSVYIPTLGESRWFTNSIKHSQVLLSSGGLLPKSIEGATPVLNMYFDADGNPTAEPVGAALNVFYYIRSVNPLSFNLQGGEWPTSDPLQDLDYDRVMFEAPLCLNTPKVDPVRAGYEFLGWTYDADGNEPIDCSVAIMPNSELVIFAQWQANTHSVNYYDSRYGAINLVAVAPIGLGEYIKLDEAPYQPGQVVVGKGTFEAWYVSIGSTWAKWPVERRVTGDVDLFAGWITDGFTVTYDLNGGTGDVPVDNDTYWAGRHTRLAYGETIVPPSGQIMVGWRAYYNGIDPVEATNVLMPSNYYPIYGDTVFSAVYADMTRAVRLVYHSNYPDGTTNISITHWQIADALGELTLLGEIFTQPDALMTGWNLAADGSSTPYAMNGKIIAPAPMTTVDLYAQWVNLTSYTVHYYYNGTAISLAPSMVVPNQISGDIITEHALVLDGYRVVSTTPQTITLANSGNMIVFYYEYKDDIRVTFDPNTTDFVIGPTPPFKTVTYNLPYGPLATVYRPNHTFLGWFDQPAGGTQVTAATIVTDFDDHTLYAVWRQVTGIDDFTKTASDGSYLPGVAGQNVSYELTFTLPADVSDYERLKVEDIYPAAALSFVSATIDIDGAGAVAITPSYTAAGVVGFVFEAADLADMAGCTITITLSFDISVSATGVITNSAAFFITPKGGTDPDDPDGEDEEEILPRDLTVTYHANNASATGTAPIDPNSPYVSGARVTILGKGDLAL